MSTGRGGAGNMRSSSAKAAPTYIKQGSQTPNILQPIYSTGRGGAGNMMKNFDSKLTRKAQDVDEDTISAMHDIDEQLEIRRGVEHLSSRRSRTHGQVPSGDDCNEDDDYISPIISSTENYVTHTISNVISHISSGGKSANSKDSAGSASSKSGTHKNKHNHHHQHHQKIRPQEKKQASQKKKQQPIIIGRGGAGNIVSPASSTASTSKLKSKLSQHVSPQGNAEQQIQQQPHPHPHHKKGSFLSSILSIFA